MIENRKKEYIKNCTGSECRKDSAQKKRIFSRILFYFLLVAFVGTIIYVAVFSPYLKITNISVNGNLELNSADISGYIENSLDGNYANIIPKNNFLFISTSRYEVSFKNNYKKIKRVIVTKKFPDSLNVEIQEYKALLVWCANDQCYMVDDKGIAYAQADFNSPDITQNHLIRINDNSGQNISLGSPVVDPTYAEYVLGLKEALSFAGITLDNDSFQTPSRMAEEIDVKTQNAVELLFSTQYPREAAIKTLDIILKKQIPADQQNNIAYIDLRSEGKAFYKLNSDAAQASDEQKEKNSSDEEKEKKN